MFKSPETFICDFNVCMFIFIAEDKSDPGNKS